MSKSSWFTYCPYCATPLIPFVDVDIPRRKCARCGWIQFRNPTVGVAVALLRERELLLGLRRDGGWCIPCGHVEWDESIEEAAVRELAEETGLTVALDGVLAVHSNFHQREQQTVGIWYRGRYIGGELQAGADLVDVAFVDIFQLPELKFVTDARVGQLLRDQIATRG